MSKVKRKSNKNIKVYLNNMDYRYDVFQMINLFFSFLEIQFIEEQYDFKVEVSEKKVLIYNNLDSVPYEYIVDETYTLREEVKKSVFKYFSNVTEKNLPWGTLIGIRPSKRAMALLDEGKSEDYIIDYFKRASLTRADKVKLCIDVAKREKEFVNKHLKTISVYIGMPFCPTRCLYCSFASNPIGKYKNKVQIYLEALIKEIKSLSSYIDKKGLIIECLYFGGGTPTSVDETQFSYIMNNIYKYLALGRNIKEFTVECGRPDSITYNKLLSMKENKVDRISINPQTMNDDTLKLIGRNHSKVDINNIFKMARNLNFENINMDMIVGLPGEKLEHIERTCKSIKALNPDSLTVHGLSVKRASRLHENIINNIEYEIASQNELNNMFERTVELSNELNMKPYYMYRQKNMVGNMENIGYSHNGKESVYNIQMMEDKQTIIALGADAVSKVVFLEDNKIERFGNVKDVDEYINRIDEMIQKKIELLDNVY